MTERLRRWASIVLTVLAAFWLLGGGVNLYLREVVIDEDAFADRAIEALEQDEVRTVATNEIVVHVVDRGSTKLVSFRPAIESVVGALIETPPFKKAYREGVIQGHRLLFVRGDNIAVELGDATTLITEGLRSVSPKVAKAVPKDLQPKLLSIRKSDVVAETLRTSEDVKEGAIVQSILALLAFALSIFVAPNRRNAVTRNGIAVGVVGAIVLAGLLVGRHILLSKIGATDAVEQDQARAAASALWDIYLGDLELYAILVGAFGLMIAAASSSLLQPFEAAERRERALRIFTARPSTAWGRLLRGAAALVIGIFALIEPNLTTQVVAVIFGAMLLYFGTSEVLGVIQPAEPEKRKPPVERLKDLRKRRGPIIAGAGGLVLLVVLVIIAVGGGGKKVDQAKVKECLGSEKLCDKRLNEVTFAGTHNSFSGADQRGWYFANQGRGITQQLKDGIRLFLIDPHYGVKTNKGVRTDLEREGQDRNRIAAKLSPRAVVVAERLVGSLGIQGKLEGKREIFLCHSLCELGSRRMEEELEVIRKFLEDNPGEIVVFLVEPSADPEDVVEEFKRAGLDKYVVTLDRDEPLPTVGELVRRNERAIVFGEKDVGAEDWYMDGFSFIQDTPLGVKSHKEFQCDRERGDSDSPLLMINHWLDGFPPPVKPNVEAGTREVLLRRARRCQRERDMKPNLIAVDHYNRGAVVEVVRRLNGLPAKKD